MHSDASNTNPYASPRHETVRTPSTARWWKYHCPACDAVCLKFWKSRRGRPDNLPPFPCPSCGAMLQFQSNEKTVLRDVIIYTLVIVASFSAPFVLKPFGLLDDLAMPALVVMIFLIPCGAVYTAFKSFSVRKASELDLLEDSAIAGGGESGAS